MGTRGPYTVFTQAQKYEIGKGAVEIGTTTAMRYYATNYPDLSKKHRYSSLRTCTKTVDSVIRCTSHIPV